MIIKNGTIVTENETITSDLLIENGKICKISNNLDTNGHKIIDAKGMFVVPGGVDVHTHFNLNAGGIIASDDFYTGSVAAACGGTTTIVDHIGFGPKNCNLSHQINKYHEFANGNSVIDYSFHGVIQYIDKNILEEIDTLVDQGIQSFKIYMTYDDMINDSSAYQLLKKMKNLGIVAVHAENDSLIKYFREYFILKGNVQPKYHALSRPDICEAEAVNRILKIAKLAEDAPIYIVHLSTELGLIEAINARKLGQKNIFLETCTQYLTLTDENYEKPNNEGLKYIMSPPLRKKDDIEALWNGIKNGYIQVVATDHCPFNFEKEKIKGANDFTKCPNGSPGVEERILLMYSEGVSKGRIDINKFVEVTSTNPAKIYGLYPEKGTIKVGSDADLTIINPNKMRTLSINNLHTAADYSLYEGYKVFGDIEFVISKGNIIVKDNQFLGNKGDGKFLKRYNDTNK